MGLLVTEVALADFRSFERLGRPQPGQFVRVGALSARIALWLLGDGVVVYNRC